MARLSVKYVGPIKEGLQGDSEFIEFKGVTLFIGDQGSGKSTVAKLYATLSWLEKAFMRGDFSVAQFNARNGFENQLKYQGIDGYLSDQSEIEYQGEAYTIIYKGRKNKNKSKKEITAILKKRKTSYSYPQIMYVPAERNFVSSIAKATSIPFLPAPLFTFLAEYKDAQEATKDIIDLPVSGVRFRYNASSDTAYILGEDYEVNLLYASSGFQSMTPLYLVTQYLSNNIDKAPDIGTNRISLKQKDQLQKIAEQTSSTWIRDWASQKLEDQLQYNNFINIVEELEQNLYPSSQKQLLFSLIASKNEREEDRLVLITHSLYLLGYLSISIEAYNLLQKVERLPEQEKQEWKNKIKKIIPIEAALDPSIINIYQLNSNGSIEILEGYEGMVPDENDLNEAMEVSNEDFIDLIELENQLNSSN